MFIAIDLVVFITTTVALIYMHDDWQKCVYDFDIWTLSIICLMFCSLALSGLQAISRSKLKKYSELAGKAALRATEKAEQN